ncbi:hypothetical protein ACN47E_006568 [Coniothyrium glycines]
MSGHTQCGNAGGASKPSGSKFTERFSIETDFATMQQYVREQEMAFKPQIQDGNAQPRGLQQHSVSCTSSVSKIFSRMAEGIQKTRRPKLGQSEHPAHLHVKTEQHDPTGVPKPKPAHIRVERHTSARRTCARRDSLFLRAQQCDLTHRRGGEADEYYLQQESAQDNAQRLTRQSMHRIPRKPLPASYRPQLMVSQSGLSMQVRTPNEMQYNGQTPRAQAERANLLAVRAASRYPSTSSLSSGKTRCGTENGPVSNKSLISGTTAVNNSQMGDESLPQERISNVTRSEASAIRVKRAPPPRDVVTSKPLPALPPKSESDRRNSFVSTITPAAYCDRRFNMTSFPIQRRIGTTHKAYRPPRPSGIIRNSTTDIAGKYRPAISNASRISGAPKLPEISVNTRFSVNFDVDFASYRDSRSAYSIGELHPSSNLASSHHLNPRRISRQHNS